jgi:hypothetical protein
MGGSNSQLIWRHLHHHCVRAAAMLPRRHLAPGPLLYIYSTIFDSKDEKQGINISQEKDDDDEEEGKKSRHNQTGRINQSTALWCPVVFPPCPHIIKY